MSDLSLRQANLSDAKILFDLRNHPKVREKSHNTDIIDFDTHQKWLDKIVLDASKVVYIAEKEGNFIGMVRFEKINDVYLMSWAISPKFQGQGFGKEVVRHAAKTMSDDAIRAEIKQDNLASIKIAEYIGMKLIKTSGNILFYQK